MSNTAVSWVRSLEIKPSSRKFVLYMLADRADDTGFIAYPSIPQLVEDTCQDRKTVQAHLAALEEAGLITDTGERRGQTKQVKVFRLNVPKSGMVKTPESNDPKNGNNPKNGTVPKTERNDPNFGQKRSQKRDPEASGKHQEASIKKTTQKKSLDLSAWQSKPSADVWKDYQQHRKNIKAPLTQTVVNRMAKRINQLLSDSGLDADEVLGLAMERGWRGIEVEWVRNALNQNRQQPASKGAQQWDDNDTSWAEDLGL